MELKSDILLLINSDFMAFHGWLWQEETSNEDLVENLTVFILMLQEVLSMYYLVSWFEV